MDCWKRDFSPFYAQISNAWLNDCRLLSDNDGLGVINLAFNMPLLQGNSDGLFESSNHPCTEIVTKAFSLGKNGMMIDDINRFLHLCHFEVHFNI